MRTATAPAHNEAPASRAPVSALLTANAVSLIGNMMTLIALPIIAAVFFLIGLSGGPLNPLLVTIRHERIPTLHEMDAPQDRAPGIATRYVSEG